jgi:hypothetical protein
VQAIPSGTGKKSHRWKLIGLILLIAFVSAVVAVRITIKRAQPILRSRVIETLSSRFQSKVDLATLDVSISNGLEVSGSGLEIYGKTDPNPYAPGVQPMISLQEFHFHTGIRNLFRPAVHVDTVYVKGMELNVPPKSNRQELSKVGSNTRKIKIYVDNFVCEDTKLLINTANPDKPPLEFNIGSIRMQDIGPGLPMRFEATLVNPKPVGDIYSTGLFGPFDETGPRDTPVQGEYSFSQADLGTIKGIAGILSSTGKYEGTLSSIQVDGTTDTPDFRISRSGHAMPLHTDFHAIVDGTNGDTYLRPVRAKLQDSTFTANGSVTRVRNPLGHDIELEVVVDNAQIQDFLKLGVRTQPPVMSGPLQMKAKMSLPPGKAEIADRLELAGDFAVSQAHFSNQKIQDRLDSLSLRTQGKTDPARTTAIGEVPANLRGSFTLKNGSLSFSSLQFMVPGTQVNLTGNYSLDGQVFDFRGEARLDAKLSQMTTGWKSMLLRPVDRFFSKDGAGTEIPIKITGTQAEPHFGLDFRDKTKKDKANTTSSYPSAAKH